MNVNDNNLVYVSAETARTYTADILEKYGIPRDNARIIAKYLVEADLRGVDTHGMNRLIPYSTRLSLKLISPTAVPTIKEIGPCIALVDGQNAFGHLVAHHSMLAAIRMAKSAGIGLVAVRNSNHFGMSASYVLQAVREGLCALVFTNSSPAMPAFGSSTQLLGVSPIAAGAPGPDKGVDGDGNRIGGEDFVLDMAPSVAARGKVHKALRRGERIPDDWALDAEGRPTTDPAEALKGVMLPMAGPKGSGLALMMDVFSGVLTGAKFGGEVVGPYDTSEKGLSTDAGVGHFIFVMKSGMFLDGGEDEFRERLSELYVRVTGGEKREGVDRIWFPGEKEAVMQRKREKEGIPFTRSEVQGMNAIAESVGVPPLTTSETPFS